MTDLSLPTYHEPNWATQGALPDTLNVVCVMWGDKYAPKYIDRLLASVERNLPDDLDFQLYCVTDSATDIPGVVTLRAERGKSWPIWWHKMNLFDAAIMPHGPTLYIDLDSVIVSSLEPLIRSKSDKPMIIVENFSPNKRHCLHNSSAMLYDVGDPRIQAMFESFVADASVTMSKLHGDQCAVWRLLREDIANFERKYVVSYKYHCRNKRLPADACAVIFHGKPDPHEVADAWVTDHWRT